MRAGEEDLRVLRLDPLFCPFALLFVLRHLLLDLAVRDGQQAAHEAGKVVRFWRRRDGFACLHGWILPHRG